MTTAKKKAPLIPVRDLFSGDVLLARCRRPALKAGWTQEDWDEFLKEAKTGNRSSQSDYDHLVQTIMTFFEETDE